MPELKQYTVTAADGGTTTLLLSDDDAQAFGLTDGKARGTTQGTPARNTDGTPEQEAARTGGVANPSVVSKARTSSNK